MLLWCTYHWFLLSSASSSSFSTIVVAWLLITLIELHDDLPRSPRVVPYVIDCVVPYRPVQTLLEFILWLIIQLGPLKFKTLEVPTRLGEPWNLTLLPERLLAWYEVAIHYHLYTIDSFVFASQLELKVLSALTYYADAFRSDNALVDEWFPIHLPEGIEEC